MHACAALPAAGFGLRGRGAFAVKIRDCLGIGERWAATIGGEGEVAAPFIRQCLGASEAPLKPRRSEDWRRRAKNPANCLISLACRVR